MRRFTAGLLLLLFVIGVTGCWHQAAAPPPLAVTEPADGREKSQQAIDLFMSARVAGQLDLVRPYLTARARAAGGILLSTPDDRFAGWNAWLEEQRGSTYKYRLQILLSYADRAYSRYLVEFVTIRRTGSLYLVDEVQFFGQREATGRAADKELWLKWLGREKRLLGTVELPTLFKPYGSGASFGVGKTRFTALAVAPDGRRIAFGSGFTHGYLGLLTLGFENDELVSAPLQEGLDLYFAGAARELVFSPSGRYLAALVQGPSGSTALQVWDLSQRAKLAVNGFPVLKHPWKVKDPVWLPDGRLQFRVQHSGGVIGPYRYDPETQKVLLP